MLANMKNVAAVATFFLALEANCHMLMRSPVPYGKSSLNNSPLDASGSDFPCKQRPGVYDAEGAQNIMAIGESQTLSFTGSAVHGGGSCQVSLTTDLQPTKNSKWMVIKSIEGGCPASVPGNLPADPNGTGASTFQFSIPNGIAPGEYTLAWTWFNKVGNREMYMNCAPATVVGSKKRWAPTPKISKRQSSFPDLFVANLASINTCTTPESFDYIFPNPGAVVESVGAGPFTQLSCGAGGGNTTPQQPTGAPANGGGAPAPTGSAGNGGGAPVATGAPGGSPGGSPGGFRGGPGGSGGSPNGGSPTFAYGPGAPAATQPAVFASDAVPIATDALSVVPVTVTGEAAPVATDNVPAPAPAPVAPDNSGNSSGSTTPESSGSCTDGDWDCATDGLSFKRCVAGGTWSVSMNMAAGLVCTPGVSSTLDMKAMPVKRSHSHAMRHIFGSTH
ncbi:hypothetical protein B0A52_08079 [Exophiala mesophila]|uniref:Chitin-binding type-4 domain-containing protein n=1 Tax=Exophiala mesophila TaxID=212818 RepID=A0A438N004_EXOME|nr:hypothetical protein B0A52_08079 [Exophiala mesophila]